MAYPTCDSGRWRRVTRIVVILVALSLCFAPAIAPAEHPQRPLVVGVCESGVMVVPVVPSDNVTIWGDSSRIVVDRYPRSTPLDGTQFRYTADETSSKSCPRELIRKVVVRAQPDPFDSRSTETGYPCRIPQNGVLLGTELLRAKPDLVIDVELGPASPPLTIRARTLFVGTDANGRTAMDATGDGTPDILVSGVKTMKIVGTDGPDRISGAARPAYGFAAASIPLTICGGGGRDVLTGGAAGDWIQGGDERDSINSADGRYDRVASQSDGDFVYADRVDAVRGAGTVRYAKKR